MADKSTLVIKSSLIYLFTTRTFNLFPPLFHCRVTTHNNDCQECDIRITHVPARDWPAGSKRPILDINVNYPRYIETASDSIHGPDYLPELIDYSIYNWTARAPYFYLDQVPHTYAYTLGTYAIQNEKQVSIGESTCSAVFFAVPLYAGGKAVFHMETLTEIALERCATARCAIELMGSLSVQYGFFGGDWDTSIEAAQDEAGEALTVSDADETWMFHVLPDDSGSSAIWVAQRVPDDHITAVANQFVIGEIDLSDTKNFLASSNIYDVAMRNGLWHPSSGISFNFLKVYGVNRFETGFACTRRVWRVFTLAAPSLLPVLSAYTDGLGSFGYGPDGSQPYPFSVKVDKPLTVQDIMRMNRDQFEGTDFDMSANLDAGLFGDPMRFPPKSKYSDPVNGVEWSDYNKGLGFQRPISLWRTAYSTITQSRRSLPDVVGAVTWIAQYAPHHSSFVPVYAAATRTPRSLNVGNQYKFEKESNWWIHCLTGNYLSRWYKYTIGEVQRFQKKVEAMLLASTAEAEAAVLKKLSGRQLEEAGISRHQSPELEVQNYLADFHDTVALTVRDKWWEFFFQMAGKFRDMYAITDPHASSFSYAYSYLTVSRFVFQTFFIYLIMNFELMYPPISPYFPLF